MYVSFYLWHLKQTYLCRGKICYFCKEFLKKKKKIWIPNCWIVHLHTFQQCHLVESISPPTPSPTNKHSFCLGRTHTGKGSASALDSSFIRYLWIPKVPIITFLQTASSYRRGKKNKKIRTSSACSPWSLKSSVLWKGSNYLLCLFNYFIRHKRDFSCFTSPKHVNSGWIDKQGSYRILGRLETIPIIFFHSFIHFKRERKNKSSLLTKTKVALILKISTIYNFYI